MSEEIGNRQQRKHFYIDKRFQNDFIIKFCSLVVAGALLTIVLLYWLSHNSTSVSIINSRVVVMTTADFILPLLIQTVLVVTAAVSVAVIIVLIFKTHKIVGPLYRFRQSFKDVSQGNLSDQVRLRRDDQLLETVEEFNAMTSALRARVLDIQKELATLQADANAIDVPSLDEKRRQQLQELNLTIKRLEQSINFFRV